MSSVFATVGALAGEILVNAKPPVDDDVVYLHAAVEGLAVGIGDTGRGSSAASNTSARTSRWISTAGHGARSPGRRRHPQ